MNLLYCGDGGIEKGISLSVLSLVRQIQEPLNVYVLTARVDWNGHRYEPITEERIAQIRSFLKEADERNQITKIDISEQFQKQLPEANMDTRFTPCCMLRLYADQIAGLPERLLYLDADVLCRGDPSEFYHQDMEDWEIAGTLDYYGRWFFRKRLLHMDYLNSGVLLLNLKRIRETGLFAKCRELCRKKKMFMPDQSALNKLAAAKKIVPRKYNEQRKLQKDTVLQHFTTTFRFFPWVHTVSAKPWEPEKLHTVLKLYEYDELLEQYQAYEE
ncbi:MAG: glycosyltransferase [Eubacteriales bacterium]|nr:glycosyltransferase [Eubacteriales bacterium]